MGKYKRSSFQMKLLGLFLGVIVLFGVLYSVFYGISQKMLRKNAIAYSEIYVDNISNSISSMVQEVDRLSRTFLLEREMIYYLGESIPEDAPEYMDYYRNVRKLLERTLNVRIDIEGIMIVDSSGRVITGGPNVPYIEGANIFHEAWYQEFLQSDQMFQVMPLQKSNAVEVFSIARKLRSYEIMQVNGVVRIDMKKALLDQICNKGRLEQNSVVLFDQNKTWFYLSGNRPDDKALAEIKTKLTAEKNNFQIQSGSGDLIVSSTYSEYLKMYIVYIVPQNILWKDLHHLNNVAVILLFIGGSMGIVLAVGASRIMSRGVAKIMAGMEEVEAGNLDVLVEVESNDEMQTIAGGLNRMVKQIRVLIEC